MCRSANRSRLSRENGLQLFTSVHQMIQSHYVETMDTTSIVAHGTESLWLALENEKFLEHNLFGADPDRLEVDSADELRHELLEQARAGQHEATNLIREICKLSHDTVGLESRPICHGVRVRGLQLSGRLQQRDDTRAAAGSVQQH